MTLVFYTMEQKENIIVKASIFRFFLFHIIVGATISIIYGFITRSYMETIIVLSVVILIIPISFFLIDANEKNIAIDAEKVEGPGRSSIFTTKRISIPLKDVDLLSSKNRPLWMGGSYVASIIGTKILLNKLFLRDDQVDYIFKVLESKLCACRRTCKGTARR